MVLWPWDARTAAEVSRPGRRRRRLERTSGWWAPPLMGTARVLGRQLADRYEEEVPLTAEYAAAGVGGRTQVAGRVPGADKLQDGESM